MRDFTWKTPKNEQNKTVQTTAKNPYIYIWEIRMPSFISIKNVNDEIIMKQNDWK